MYESFFFTEAEVYFSPDIVLPSGVFSSCRSPFTASQLHHEVPLQCAARRFLRSVLLRNVRCLVTVGPPSLFRVYYSYCFTTLRQTLYLLGMVAVGYALLLILPAKTVQWYAL